MVDIDIRSYEELKDVEITVKCKRCGITKGNFNKNYNGRPNQLSINWTEQKMIFKCGFCGYNTEFEL